MTQSVPWVFWPFVAIWRLLAGILNLTGRLLGIIVGLLLLVVGLVLSITLIGAVVGIPIMLVGFLLVVRGLFRKSGKMQVANSGEPAACHLPFPTRRSTF